MMIRTVLSADDPGLLMSFTKQRVQLAIEWLGAAYGKRPIDILLVYARASSYSLRNRIVPRFLFFRYLRKQPPGTCHGCHVHQSSKVEPVHPKQIVTHPVEIFEGIYEVLHICCYHCCRS